MKAPNNVVEKLDALRSAQNAGLSVPNPRTTVGEYLARWLADIVPDSVGPVNTLDNYEWAVRLHLIPALGHRPLVKLTPADVVEMLRAKNREGMARNTVTRLRSILASALDQALVGGLVVRNVAAITKPPKGGTVPHGRSLDLAEARALLIAAKGSRLEGRIRHDADARPTSRRALGLRWEDLDVAAGTLRIERSLKRERGVLRLGPTKTCRSRRVLGVPAPVSKALAAHRRRQAKERLRAGKTGI